MKTLMLLLVVSAVILSPLACSEAMPAQQEDKKVDQRIVDLQRQIADLNAKVADLNAKLAEKSKASTIEQQAKCAERAYKDFDDWGFKVKENADVVSHYNHTLDRCFVQFQNTAARMMFTSINLFDAYGGKQYGEYEWKKDEHKSDWEVAPFVCSVTPPSGKEKYCHSDDEYKEMVRVYLED